MIERKTMEIERKEYEKRKTMEIIDELYEENGQVMSLVWDVVTYHASSSRSAFIEYTTEYK